LLVERSRNLVVRMKDDWSFHQRALVVYRNILCMRYSRTGINSSQQQREGQVAGSLVTESNTESSSQTSMPDEEFDEAMSLEFPDTVALADESSISIEFCFNTSQRQPSRISYELPDKFNELSGESISIFKKPTVTNEG